MAKAKQKLQPSAEVIPILQASCTRLEKLLAICEVEMDALMIDATVSGVTKARQIQILSRTIQGLQKDWIKYMGILHPDVPVTPPQSSNSRRSYQDIESMSDKELHEEIFKYLHGGSEDNEDEENTYELFVAHSRSAIAPSPSPSSELPEKPLQQTTLDVQPTPMSSLSSSSKAKSQGCSFPVLDNSQEAHFGGEHTEKSSEAEINRVESQANQPRQSGSTAKRLKKPNQYTHRFFKKPPPQNLD